MTHWFIRGRMTPTSWHSASCWSSMNSPARHSKRLFHTFCPNIPSWTCFDCQKPTTMYQSITTGEHLRPFKYNNADTLGRHSFLSARNPLLYSLVLKYSLSQCENYNVLQSLIGGINNNTYWALIRGRLFEMTHLLIIKELLKWAKISNKKVEK